MSKFFLLSLGSLLSFSLAAQKISTRNGEVSFFSEAPVENIEAVNNQVSSVLNLENGQFAFLVPIKAFVFEKALMQEHFNENYLESAQYPNATFKGQIENWSAPALSQDGEYNWVFKGTMNMHGVEQPFSERVKATVKEGKIALSCDFMLKASDYAVKIPASKKDNINNELALTLKLQYD